MHEIVREALARGRGALTNQDLARHTSADRVRSMLRAAQRAEELVRVGRGAYVSAEKLAAATPEQAHLLRARALLAARAGEVVASHTTGALVWELPVDRSLLDRVHLMRAAPVGTTRRHPGHTVHLYAGEGSTVVGGGTPVVPVGLAVVGTAMLGGTVAGVCAADAALRGGMVTEQQLKDWALRFRHVAGVEHARQTIRRASPLADAPSESRARLVLEDLG